VLLFEDLVESIPLENFHFDGRLDVTDELAVA
jgi:hypothetical protein